MTRRARRCDIDCPCLAQDDHDHQPQQRDHRRDAPPRHPRRRPPHTHGPNALRACSRASTGAPTAARTSLGLTGTTTRRAGGGAAATDAGGAGATGLRCRGLCCGFAVAACSTPTRRGRLRGTGLTRPTRTRRFLLTAGFAVTLLGGLAAGAGGRAADAPGGTELGARSVCTASAATRAQTTTAVSAAAILGRWPRRRGRCSSRPRDAGPDAVRGAAAARTGRTGSHSSVGSTPGAISVAVRAGRDAAGWLLAAAVTRVHSGSANRGPAAPLISTRAAGPATVSWSLAGEPVGFGSSSSGGHASTRSRASPTGVSSTYGSPSKRSSSPISSSSRLMLIERDEPFHLRIPPARPCYRRLT